MTRKKVKLMWIVNDSARKASFKKRRGGLLKKVSELTTLCGVSAFVIVYGPDDQEGAVWPSQQAVQQLLAKFQSVPDIERCKKMMNQETYLRERTTKVQDQLRKQQRKNKEVEVGHLIRQIQQGRKVEELEMNEMAGLAWMLEEKMKECRKRKECFEQVPHDPGSFPSPKSAALVDEMGGMGGGTTAAQGKFPTESFMWDQWFIDMMRQNENAAGSSSVKTDIGLSPHAYVGGPSGASDVGLPYGNLGGSRGGIEMGLPLGNYSGSSRGSEMGGLPYGSFGINSGASDIGQPHGNFGGIGGGGGDIWLGQPYDQYRGNMRGGSTAAASALGLGMPLGNPGSSSAAGVDAGLNPGALFGGSSAGSNAGLPYDVTKPWPNIFYP
ncbi:MADS-box transcription factor 50 [Juglans microcarpa x Juglans regia]|uniref:MADS-box transcription factor 50 n=1 Tax=Juglans microcarpa x Juglans regia TaxID=2249226 RepID=UPI001B7D9CE1|nr:MADS-box transcription factor 50 [Juglans microcarpa x Juglans regia]